MPKFSIDRENLLKTLSTLDNGVTVSEVITPESEERTVSTMALHVVLEAFCAMKERDEDIRGKLFNGIVAFLTDLKLLDETIVLTNLRKTRKEMAMKFLKLASEVHNVINPNPTLDRQCITFQPDSSEDQNKYSIMFEQIKVIAKGGFGIVCMARHRIDGLVYAVKKITFRYRTDSDYRKVIREVQSIATLSHPNIVSYNNAWIEDAEEQTTSSSDNDEIEGEDSSIHSTSSRSIKWDESSMESNSSRPNNIQSKFFQSSSDDSTESLQITKEFSDSNVTEVGDISVGFMYPKVTLCIQMEYCDCDLRHWLDKRLLGESFPLKMSEVSIFRDILMGVAHIHSKSFIHRDLKPQNIFFSQKKGVMKIGDFGLATLGGSSPSKQQQGNISIKLSSDLGTLPYAAPEQRNKHNYTNKVDMYSLGIILIELLLQIGTQNELARKIEMIGKGDIPEEMASEWPSHVFLVENLIQKDPNLRLSAKEILNLPVIQSTENIKKFDGTQTLVEELAQKCVEQRSLIAQQALIIEQLKRQIEELTCN